MRSAIPSYVASGRCAAPSNTRCSYTSSVITTRSCSTATAATARSSSSVSTVPVGLCGELISSTVVRSVTAARSASRSSRKSGARSVTGTRRAARHRDTGGVRVVVRLQRDHLVARFDERQQRRGDGLGRTRGDQDLGGRVDLDPVVPPLVVRDRVPQLRDAAAGRVLVRAGADRADGVLEQRVRAVGVRETLAQVHRTGPDRERGHLGEDRGPEALQTTGKLTHAPDPTTSRGRGPGHHPATIRPRGRGQRAGRVLSSMVRRSICRARIRIGPTLPIGRFSILATSV